MESKEIARGLGWFGIGLGIVELLSPKTVADIAGLKTDEGLIQFCGIREILSGIAILNAEEPEQWLWLRVAGDMMDAALLATGLHPWNKKWRRSLAASLAVSPVVALDFLHAKPPLKSFL